MFGFKLPRYSKLLKKSNADNEDKEKKALFWIIAKNKELYEKVDYIYDFDRDTIKVKVLENQEKNLSIEERKLLILGFNLFNGYTIESDDVVNIFNDLSHKNFRIALNAILLRYGKELSAF